jgi:hypothetical protein
MSAKHVSVTLLVVMLIVSLGLSPAFALTCGYPSGAKGSTYYCAVMGYCYTHQDYCQYNQCLCIILSEDCNFCIHYLYLCVELYDCCDFTCN